MQAGDIYLAQFPFGDVPGMKLRPVLRLHKVATIHVSSLARHLGVLDASQQTIVASKLRTFLGL